MFVYTNPEVPLLGHKVSWQGLKMDPKKFSIIQGLHCPSLKPKPLLFWVWFGVSNPVFLTLKDNQTESFQPFQDIKDAVEQL